MLQPSIDFCVLILAGGESKRMGSNKALLRASEGSPNLLESVVARVRRAGPQEIYIVANASSPFDYLGLPIVSDNADATGPLAGIIGGLHASRCEANFVVACDMPDIDPDIVSYMVSLEGDYDAIVPRWVSSLGRTQVETLHAIYSRSALSKLHACASAGNLALHSCLQSLNVRYVEENELQRFGQAASTFRNLNSPADWLEYSNGDP